MTTFPLLASGCYYNQDHELLRPKVKSESTFNQQLPIENYNTPLAIGTKQILIEIADTDNSREQGLSNRDVLSDENGMLFKFQNTNTPNPSFWMKDMKFNLDMIWINNQKIIGITPNIPAPENNLNLPTYSPPSNITDVLEVAAGFTERNNIKIGDTVK